MSASRYPEIYAHWRRDPQGFWGEAAREIDWIEPARTIFDPKSGIYGRWFAGGVVNTCRNALDRHVKAGRGEQAALIYDSPVTGVKRRFSYADMLAEVQAVAAMLRDFDVEKDDRVVIYMPIELTEFLIQAD